MRVCLSVEIQEGLSYEQTLALTQRGEALGFEASLLAEHYYPSGPLDQYRGGPAETVAADAWIYLAAMARETSRIRLGTLVSPVTFRHPVVLAKLAATLDQVSHGRAELGIGAGWLEPEHQAFGFPFPAPPRRVDLVEEQLTIITGLWSSGQPFSFDGAHYRLEQASFSPRPVQQPRLPIIVGGRTTSQRLPRLAGRFADEYVIGQPSPDECQAVRTRLDRASQAAGRPVSAVRLSVFVPICVATTSAGVEGLLETYRQSNPQYVRMMGDTSRWLIGTPVQVRQQLQRLADAGIDRVMVSVNCDQHLDMLDLLAEAQA